MDVRSLFRPEAVRHAAQRLDGVVLVAVPAPVWLSGALLCLTLLVALIFVANASYARREAVRGWISLTSGVVNVQAPASLIVRASGVAEGDSVRAGQAVAWVELRNVDTDSGAQGRYHVLTAPVSGRMLFAKAQVGDVVEPGVLLFVVAPDSGQLAAKMLVPSRAIGFLQVGQQVSLALDSFPYQRFGRVAARISSISESSLSPGQTEALHSFDEPSYLVQADLESTYLMAYGRPVYFRIGMQFQADVIVDNRTMAEWILDPLFASSRFN